MRCHHNTDTSYFRGPPPHGAGRQTAGFNKKVLKSFVTFLTGGLEISTVWRDSDMWCCFSMGREPLKKDKGKLWESMGKPSILCSFIEYLIILDQRFGAVRGAIMGSTTLGFRQQLGHCLERHHLEKSGSNWGAGTRNPAMLKRREERLNLMDRETRWDFSHFLLGRIIGSLTSDKVALCWHSDTQRSVSLPSTLPGGINFPGSKMKEIEISTFKKQSSVRRGSNAYFILACMKCVNNMHVCHNPCHLNMYIFRSMPKVSLGCWFHFTPLVGARAMVCWCPWPYDESQWRTQIYNEPGLGFYSANGDTRGQAWNSWEITYILKQETKNWGSFWLSESCNDQWLPLPGGLIYVYRVERLMTFRGYRIWTMNGDESFTQ